MIGKKLHDHMFHVTVILCTDEDAFYRHVEKYQYDGAKFPSAGGASTIMFDTDNSGMVVMVSIGSDDGWPVWETEFTLIHEAVHVKQFVLEAAYEQKVGVETEAYMVEYYARFLICEFRRRQLIASRKK